MICMITCGPTRSGSRADLIWTMSTALFHQMSTMISVVLIQVITTRSIQLRSSIHSEVENPHTAFMCIGYADGRAIYQWLIDQNLSQTAIKSVMLSITW